jgi:alpha-beta hydrolase superfamily lysophospholipase
MFEETERLSSPTGARIACHRQLVSGPARGILLIAHGLAEHSRRYERFALAMTRQGFHVYAFDHRGHGETTAPDAPLGRFALRSGVERVVEDVKAVRAHAAAAHPNLPIILFGHSMGGLIALNAAVDHPHLFDALAVWNANFNPGLAGRAAQAILKVERALKGSDVPSTLLPRLTFEAWGRAIPNHRTDFDWLSHDPAEVDAYVQDPLCGFSASVSLWLDVFAMTFRAPKLVDRMPRKMPIHLLGGGEDPATHHGRAVLWLSSLFQRSNFTNVTTRIWPTALHETLNDVIRVEAMDEFANWARSISPVPAEAVE